MLPNTDYSAEQMIKLWDNHTKYEFEDKDVDATMSTMAPNPSLINVPVITGGSGYQEVRQFYTSKFIHKLPLDTTTELISRTVGSNQIVDELIFKFTHNIEMDWILPGVPPTGKYVEVPLVVIVRFDKDKIIHEHIYWDQASVLVQIGLLKQNNLPVCGIESARALISSLD